VTSLNPQRTRGGCDERHAGYWLDRYVDSYLPEAATVQPSRLAVVDGAARLSYGELNRAVAAVTASLQRLGVRHGDVVSWQLPNWHEAAILHQAIVRAGGVSCPLTTIYRQREVTYILRESRSRVLVLPEMFRSFPYTRMLEEIRGELPELEHVVVTRPLGEQPFATFDELSRENGGAPVPVERTPDDPILLLFTSGTTARPKGVLHTHNTLDYENRSIVEVYEITGEDVIFMPSPVSHVTGLLYGLQLPWMVGASVVLQDIWDPDRALRLIAEHRCSVTVAATPFLHGLTYHPRLEEFDLSSLRLFGCGGADVPPRLIRDARKRLRCAASRIYGSSEIPTVTTCGPDDSPEKAAMTDGHPIGAARFRVVNRDGGSLGPDQVGELLVKGPELFTGYLRADDNDGSFTADGWFRTGDLAAYDDDGYLVIHGRAKDIVLRGGENISVAEVESLLFGHPAIAEIAVVAMPDPVMVERACAFVVPVRGMTITLAGLASFLEGCEIAKQKIPERLEIVSSLPRTSSGKIQKFLLRETIRKKLIDEGVIKGTLKITSG
jgi:cyclohexanecarboxylate-CoA ligase